MKTEVTEFSATAAALAELRAEANGLPSPESPEAYKMVSASIKRIDKYRTSLEKKRKELKAPLLERGKLIDDEAKRITAELVDIAAPLKEAKKAVDEKEAREKAERIARLQEKVDEIKGFPAKARGKSADEIRAIVNECGEIDTSHDFFDLTREATIAQAEAMESLKAMLHEAEERERFQAEKAQFERERQSFEAARQAPAKPAPVREAPSASARTPQSMIYQELVTCGADHELAARLVERLVSNSVPFMTFTGI